MQACDFGEVTERLRRSTVRVEVPGRFRGAGSGVIARPDGVIVTNAHVAHGPDAEVQLWDGRTFPAQLTARDARRDLASLKVETTDLPAATLADSSALRVGELVIAVGNPLGFTGALSTGIVHALGPLAGLGRQPWVQADVMLAPGNSGGPLADARGRVIGINTMIARGLALAVPSNLVERMLQHPPADYSLGVTVRPIPAGLLVLETDPRGVAAFSSLLPGDVLIGADGRRFDSVDDLGQALADSKGIMRLQFLRGGKPAVREVTVQLGERRPQAA